MVYMRRRERKTHDARKKRNRGVFCPAATLQKIILTPGHFGLDLLRGVMSVVCDAIGERDT